VSTESRDTLCAAPRLIPEPPDSFAGLARPSVGGTPEGVLVNDSSGSIDPDHKTTLVALRDVAARDEPRLRALAVATGESADLRLPDWEQWRRTSAAPLWELVALSFDVNPLRYVEYQQFVGIARPAGWPEPPAPPAERRHPWDEGPTTLRIDMLPRLKRRFEFAERLRVAINALSGAMTVSVTEATQVPVTGFVRCADSMAWQVPEQLRRLALTAAEGNDPGLLRRLPGADAGRSSTPGDAATSMDAETTTLPDELRDAESLKPAERKTRAILRAVRELGYDPMQIPTGGKTRLERECLAEPENLFRSSKHAFIGAWKAAATDERIRMAERDRFRPPVVGCKQPT
jgi:hypothetical protein